MNKKSFSICELASENIYVDKKYRSGVDKIGSAHKKPDYYLFDIYHQVNENRFKIIKEIPKRI